MNHIEPTDEMRAAFEAWAATRPDVVKANCAHFKPWAVYRNKKTDQRMSVTGYFEDGTLNTIAHPSNINPFQMQVFGVPADQLEEIIGDEPAIVWVRTQSYIPFVVTAEEIEKNLKP